MAEFRVASRYVKSLLGLAEEQGVLEKVREDMQMFSKLCHESRPFLVMLKSPVIRHDKKQNILEKVFSNKVDKLTMAFFNIITRKNREPLLPAIASEFHHAYNVYKNISQATITTAVPLDKDIRDEFEEMVKEISKKNQVELVEKVDDDLIGGFILNVANKQIDASIRNKLKSLKVKLSHNPYVKEI
jgi:F-type H+-transporting ATPase subunit delta